MACLSEHHNPSTRLCLPGLFTQLVNLEGDGSDIGMETGYAAMASMPIEPHLIYLMQDPNEEFSPTTRRGKMLFEGAQDEAGVAPPYGYSDDEETTIDQHPPTTDPPKSVKQSKRGSGGGRRRKQVMADGERREKPPKTYISLLKEAIMAQSSRAATLAEIYQYLENKDEFFRGPYVGWKNSVRHNLSISPCFVKQEKPPKHRPVSSRSALARRVGDQNAARVRGGKMGKGHKWTLVEKTKVAVEESPEQKSSRVKSTSPNVGESQESRPLKATAPLRQMTKRQPKKQQRRGLNEDCAAASQIPINRPSPIKKIDTNATPMTGVIRGYHASPLETLDAVPAESFSVAVDHPEEMAFMPIDPPSDSAICNRIIAPYHRDTIYFNSITTEMEFGETPALTPSFIPLGMGSQQDDSDNYYATGSTGYPNPYLHLAGECWSMPYLAGIQSIPNYPSPNIEGTNSLYWHHHHPYINYRAFWELNALQEVSPYLCHSPFPLNVLSDLNKEEP